MGCPPDAPKPRKNPGNPPKKASAATLATANANVVQVGGFTVTPEASPTVQLADYVMTAATDRLAPMDWNTTTRYISVVGTGESAKGHPIVFVAIEDVPKNSFDVRVATVVENDEMSRTLS